MIRCIKLRVYQKNIGFTATAAQKQSSNFGRLDAEGAP